MFVRILVLWARVCRICSRMHIHTRAYVTKKKPHVHACRHMCPSSCPTALIAIRPALSGTTDKPRSITAQLQAPGPRARRPAAASTLATSGTCSPARELAYAPARQGPAAAAALASPGGCAPSLIRPVACEVAAGLRPPGPARRWWMAENAGHMRARMRMSRPRRSSLTVLPWTMPPRTCEQVPGGWSGPPGTCERVPGGWSRPPVGCDEAGPPPWERPAASPLRSGSSSLLANADCKPNSQVVMACSRYVHRRARSIYLQLRARVRVNVRASADCAHNYDNSRSGDVPPENSSFT